MKPVIGPHPYCVPDHPEIVPGEIWKSLKKEELFQEVPANDAGRLSIGEWSFSSSHTYMRGSPSDPRPRSFHHLKDILQGGHRSVARGGHGQRAMSRATLDRPLRPLASEEAVDQS